MAFITDEAELQALLYTFTSTDEWEMLMETVLIPEDWIPMVHARLSELTAQDIPDNQTRDGQPLAKKTCKEQRCGFCGKTFTCANHLETHRRVHNSEKPRECPHHNKHFQTKSNLNKHLKAHDKRIAKCTFTCSCCGETCRICAPFNAHICTAHPTA
ncbi:hypothetical protein ACROYT_G006989 [Oculina patagonica]